jgi:hypothetical protein
MNTGSHELLFTADVINLNSGRIADHSSTRWRLDCVGSRSCVAREVARGSTLRLVAAATSQPSAAAPGERR